MPKMKLLKLSLVVVLQIYLKLGACSPSIVIVGAGAAGLAAGSRLLHAGFTNITILEAENRTGGRVHSVFFGDAFVDLGAQWCHGIVNNVVYELVQNLGLLQKTQYPSKVFHSSGKAFQKEFGDDLVKIFDQVYTPGAPRDATEGQSLGQFCIESYNKTIHKRYQNAPEWLDLAKKSLDLFHHIVLGDEGSFSWFESSAKSDYTYCGEDLDLNWNGYGYQTALEVLKPKALDEKIHLGKEVVSILSFYESSLVYCSDGTVFKADYVIFTPSVGVLKHTHHKMFYPALPRSKRKAIELMGFDGVAKIVMYWRKRWWTNAFQGFKLVWSEQDMDTAKKQFPEGLVKEGRSWLTEIYEILPGERNPNVLFAWISGRMVPKIESVANTTILQGLEYVLRKFVGDYYNVSAPDEILRTSWCTNPYFRGSFSFQTVPSRQHFSRIDTIEDELAKPILGKTQRPLVQFAGEASHPYYFSTVHGAIETGFREADRIIQTERSCSSLLQAQTVLLLLTFIAQILM